MENSPQQQQTANPIPQGCGTLSQISVHVSPTTGGDFYLTVDPDITVDNFKKLVSKRLKVPRDRICLLFRDKWVLLIIFLQLVSVLSAFSGNCRTEACSSTGLGTGPESRYCPTSKRDLSYAIIFLFSNTYWRTPSLILLRNLYQYYCGGPPPPHWLISQLSMWQFLFHCHSRPICRLRSRNFFF